MTKTHILYFYPHQQFDTGSPKALVSMIDSLDKEIYKPLFLASSDGPLNEVLKKHHVEIIFGEVNSITLKKPFNTIKLVQKQIYFLKKHKVKIIHFNHFGWNEDLAIAAYLTGIPVVHHIHNAIKIAPLNLNRFAANVFLTCSKTLQKEVANFHYISGRSKVLYNQVDTQWIETGVPIREELGLSETDIAIGVIAQICQRKGIDIFIETARLSLKTNPNLVFIVIGPDGINEDDYAAEIRTRITAPEFSGRVRLLGSRPDIPDLLASLDIFMITTRSEPFGIVVIEAMAAGLPVVASSVGGIPEIIDDKSLGFLVSPIKPDAFAKTLLDIIELPDRGRSIGFSGKESIKGRFDSETVGLRLNYIYQGLLSK